MDTENKLKEENSELKKEIIKLSNEVKALKKLYNEIMDNANIIIVRWRPDGFINFINKYGEYFFGKNNSELIGKSVNEILFKESKNVKDILQKIIQDSKRFQKEYNNIETEYRRKDGGKSWISWTHILVHYKKDEIESILSIGNDITQLKMTELKLRESEERYRGVLENIKEGYFEVDLKGNFLYVNDAFCEIFQYPREEILYENYEKFTDKENKKQIFDEFHKVFKSKKDKGTVLVVFKNRANRKVLIETSIYLRNDQARNIIGFNGISRDVTRLKRAEKRLKKSEQKYKNAFNRANMYKDLIIHDMNNILQIIQSSSEIYQISIDSKDRDEMIHLIQKNVKRGTKLVQNAMKLSLIEDTKITLKDVNLNQILSNCLDLLNEKFQEREIFVKLDAPKEVIHVNANELLTDVFENILFNAVKYCEKKVLTLYIKITRQEDGKLIRLEFKDNGIGIKDDRKKLIFETYSKKKGSKGLGFGLSLVKKIIEIYGGKVWVEDVVKGDYTQGSNFILLIPEFL